jgi:SAM-dependent methyltransferase
VARRQDHAFREDDEQLIVKMSSATSSDRFDPVLLRLLPPDARLIIEVGCGAGALAAEYKQVNPTVCYVGVERQGPPAQRAVNRMDRVFTGDAEQVEREQLGIEAGTVDCLVYGDILERLTDPWGLVQRQASWLGPNGLVLASVSNVGHWTVLVDLLRGRWRYQDEGVLDRAHLRFFTREGVIDLFSRAGLRVYDIQATVIHDETYARFQHLLRPVAHALGFNENQFVEQTAPLQFTVRAGRASPPARTLLIQTGIGEPLGCARVRVYEPDEFLATIPGVRTIASNGRMGLHDDVPGEDKMFIWQRFLPRYPHDLALLKRLLRRGYLVLAEIDDDPRLLPGLVDNSFFSLRGCHAVQTSTEPLKTFMRQYNPHVGVFPNQLAGLPPPRVYADDDRVTLFFGAIGRLDSWRPLLPALNRVLARHGPRVSVRVVWDEQFFHALETPIKTFEPFCPYPRYTEILRECHIALLPLEPTAANEMKSDLKFLECAGHGVVALASPTVYEASLVDDETGCLFRSPQQFAERLHELIGDRDLRRRLAHNAYAWVRQHRLLSQHYRKRYVWYRELRARMAQLNADLRQRTPELFAG